MANKSILLERIYDNDHQDGYRVLVDRLWPRGISKVKAALDDWCKDIAPSPELRKWFGHKPENWDEFCIAYRQELKQHQEISKELLQKAGDENLVLVYGAKDKQHTHALVLKSYLEDLIKN